MSGLVNQAISTLIHFLVSMFRVVSGLSVCVPAAAVRPGGVVAAAVCRRALASAATDAATDAMWDAVTKQATSPAVVDGGSSSARTCRCACVGVVVFRVG